MTIEMPVETVEQKQSDLYFVSFTLVYVNLFTVFFSQKSLMQFVQFNLEQVGKTSPIAIYSR